jgi:hypothetical protein
MKSIDARDIVAAVGALITVVGLWMIYPPLAVVIFGLLVVAGALIGARG